MSKNSADHFDNKIKHIVGYDKDGNQRVFYENVTELNYLAILSLASSHTVHIICSDGRITKIK
jgi:hypothetical protein